MSFKNLLTFGIGATPTQSTTTFTQPSQQITILEASNPRYPRNVILTNEGLRISRGTTVAGIKMSDLFTALLTLEPSLAYPPLFTTQPAPSTVQYSQNTTFTVVVQSEISFTYQWQVSVNAGQTWINLTNVGIYTGTTTATLTLTSITNTYNNNQYRCVATNSSGAASSSSVRLTVIEPGILTQPVNHSGAHPFTTSFTVSAAGFSALSYQWQVSINSGVSWANVTNAGIYTNATTATLNLTNADATYNGYMYRCVVTDSNGVTNSNAATLTVT